MSTSREFAPSLNALSKDGIVFSGSFTGEPRCPQTKKNDLFQCRLYGKGRI
jgi:hypothetical protein